jgi:hypothetical protein
MEDCVLTLLLRFAYMHYNLLYILVNNSAVKRRLPCQYEVGLPNETARLSILQLILKDEKVSYTTTHISSICQTYAVCALVLGCMHQLRHFASTCSALEQ